MPTRASSGGPTRGGAARQRPQRAGTRALAIPDGRRAMSEDCHGHTLTGSCDAPDLDPRRPNNRPGLPAISYRIGRHGDFLARMLHALPRESVEDRSTGAVTVPLRALTARTTDDPSHRAPGCLRGLARRAHLLPGAHRQRGLYRHRDRASLGHRADAHDRLRTQAGRGRLGASRFTVESSDDPFRGYRARRHAGDERAAPKPETSRKSSRPSRRSRRGPNGTPFPPAPSARRNSRSIGMRATQRMRRTVRFTSWMSITASTSKRPMLPIYLKSQPPRRLSRCCRSPRISISPAPLRISLKMRAQPGNRGGDPRPARRSRADQRHRAFPAGRRADDRGGHPRNSDGTIAAVRAQPFRIDAVEKTAITA